MGTKHLTKEQKAEILRVYQETKSTRATAKQLGYNIQRVRHYLKSIGEPLTGYRTTACYRNFDLVAQKAQEGRAYTEIANLVGTNHHRVKEFLDRYEIEHPGYSRAGENNPNWKGGRVVDQDGYVLLLCPDHPNADRHGYMREHRLVMEQEIGRLLGTQEVVHHMDGDKENNAPGNLGLFANNGEHLAETLKGQIPNWTQEGWERMQEGVRRAVDQRHKSIPSQS